MEPTTCPRHSPNGCYTPRGLQRSTVSRCHSERSARVLLYVLRRSCASLRQALTLFGPFVLSFCLPDVGRERRVRASLLRDRRDTSRRPPSIYHSPPRQIEDCFCLAVSWRGHSPLSFLRRGRRIGPAPMLGLAHSAPRERGAMWSCGAAPVFAAWGLPGRAPRILYVRHSRLARCQLSAERRRHSERSVPRFWFCAKRRDTQSRNLSSIYHSRTASHQREICLNGSLLHFTNPSA